MRIKLFNLNKFKTSLSFCLNLFNASMKVDRTACVTKIMDSVVNVDAMIFVCKIPLKLVPALLVVTKLVIHLL